MSSFIRVIARFQEAQRLGKDTTQLMQTLAVFLNDFVIVPEFYYLPIDISSQLILEHKGKFAKDVAIYIIENFARVYKRNCSSSVEEMNQENKQFSGLDICMQIKKILTWPEENPVISVKPPLESTNENKYHIQMIEASYNQKLDVLRNEYEEEMFRLNAVKWDIKNEIDSTDYKCFVQQRDAEKEINKLLEQHNAKLKEIHEKETEILNKINYLENRINNPITEEQQQQILNELNADHKKQVEQITNHLKEEIDYIKEQWRKNDPKRNTPEWQREEARKKKEEYDAKKEALKKAKEAEKAKKLLEKQKQEAFERSLVEVPQIIYDNFEFPEKIIKVQPIHKPKEPSIPRNPKNIFDCILANDIEKAKSLIQRKPAIVNEYGDARTLPLQQATKYDRPEIIKLLLDNGADINAKDGLGRTALHYAIINESTSLVDLLKTKNPRNDIPDREGKKAIDLLMDRRDSKTALTVAIKEDNRRAMADIFKRWPDMVNMKLSDGTQLIHTAASKGYPYSIELLLQWGADIEAKDDFNCTPFHYACKTHQDDAIQFLLDHGADYHALDNNKKLPFDYYQQ